MAASPDIIPLPPPAVTDAVSARLRRRSRFVEYALVGVVLALAFFLGSSAVRNADYWMHLATGRLIASGEYQVGVDPFSSVTQGRYWVNHSWLFDLLLFLADRGLGDGIVFVKAGLMVLLASVMVAIRRRGGDLWLPAVMVALAMVTAAPRLLLQPMLASLLLLAMSLWVLTQANRRRHWLLPPLFIVWVNLDAWFWLGPSLILVFALTDSRNRRHFLTILAVGLLACLLNPHHVRAIQLPMELSPSVLNSPLLNDSNYQRLFESPWRLARYTQTGAGLNPTGLAYFVLLAVGVLSFLRNRPALRDWRLPVWLIFAGLGAFQLRLVPFFAVVAGPITAINWQEVVAARPVRSDTHFEFDLRRGLLGRAFSLIALLLILALTWPGWLHATPHDSRRVDWAVRPDPSLVLTGETLRGWYDRGDLPAETKLFTSHPDVGAYLSWFCPPARSTIDPRLTLFTDARLTPGDEHSVLVFFDPDAVRVSSVFAGGILDDPNRYPVLFVGGKSIIVGDLKATGPQPRYAKLRFDLDRHAFREPNPPPETGGVYPVPRTIRQQFLTRAHERSPSADTATLLLRLFDESAQRRQQGKAGNPVAAVFADLAATGTVGNEMVAAAQITFRMKEAGLFVPFLDPGPPAATILAVREARRALAANPNDANAWLRLGQAYISQRLRTREGAWANSLPLLDEVRHVQTVTALENAVRLDPDLLLGHRLLANVYAERHCLDLSLDHRRRELRLARNAGAGPNESAADFAKAMDESHGKLREMEKQVQDRLNQFAIQAGGLGSKPYEQARIALKLGLVRKALDDVLLKSDVRLFGVDGARLQLELLLKTGRSDRVRDDLALPEIDDNREHLGLVTVDIGNRPGYPSAYRLPAFDWYTALLSAAAGDYDRFDRSLRAIDLRTQIDAEDDLRSIRFRLAVLLAAEIGGATMPETFIYQSRVRENRESMDRLLQGVELVKLLRADMLTVAGLLALERGSIATAREHLTRALDLVRRLDGSIRPFAGRAAAEVSLERMANNHVDRK